MVVRAPSSKTHIYVSLCMCSYDMTTLVYIPGFSGNKLQTRSGRVAVTGLAYFPVHSNAMQRGNLDANPQQGILFEAWHII